MERLFHRLTPIRLLALALLASTVSVWAMADYKNSVALFNRKKFREAIKEIQPDVAKNPEWEFGHRLIGLSYLELKEYDNASRALEKAVELKSTEPSVYLGLAQAYLNLGKADPALSMLEKGKSHLTRQKDQFEYHRLRGFALYKKQSFPEAADSLMRAIQFQSGKAQDYLMLGISFFKCGQDAKARQALTTAQQMSPGLASAAEYLDKLAAREGESALKSGNFTSARDTFQALLGRKPNDRAAQFNLALAEIGLQNWTVADGLLQPLEAFYTGSYKFLFYRGYVLEKLQKYPAAEGFYRQAAALNPAGEAAEGLRRVLNRQGKK